jgi:hypothetical protein
VTGHTGCAVAARSVGPGIRPVELPGCEACGVYPHDDIVLGHDGVRQLRQRQASDTGITIGNSDGLHYKSFLVWVVWSRPPGRSHSRELASWWRRASLSVGLLVVVRRLSSGLRLYADEFKT